MAIFNWENPEGALTIGSVLLNDRWVTVTNLLGLLPQADERGDNREIPDVDGAQGYGMLRKETEVTLRCAVRGAYLHGSDDLADDPWATVIANWLHIRADLMKYAVAGADVEQTATWEAPGDQTLTGPVQVRGLQSGDSAKDQAGDVVILFTLRVRLLDGELTLAGS